ncbi:hypothetical protein K0040_12710 [Terrisporobacter petrolearius]|uniref:hypothetical protein n=1 Tax=Terrisporobacter petrolearius TaxID=1460447 RepID=UPI001D166FD1|nr:hypothetical protein [Terrisporobacter petrolearius]MCC3865134.1 hypothetical protein [Terrisporobacter petrolearius]
MGIFSSTVSFAATSNWAGRLPGNHGNIYTGMVTKATNKRTGVAEATKVPNSGINVWIQKNRGSGALLASKPKSIYTKNVKINIDYHSYYAVGNKVCGGVENKSSGPLGFSNGTIDFR